MKTPAMSAKRKSFLFGLLTVTAFFACFILAPLGGFVVWTFGGMAVYFLFMAVYLLIPPERKRYGKTRYDPKAEEMRTYIRFHMQILLGLFLGAALFVAVMLMILL